MQQLDDGQTSADGQQNGKGHGNKNTEERTFTDEIDTTRVFRITLENCTVLVVESSAH